MACPTFQTIEEQMVSPSRGFAWQSFKRGCSWNILFCKCTPTAPPSPSSSFFPLYPATLKNAQHLLCVERCWGTYCHLQAVSRYFAEGRAGKSREVLLCLPVVGASFNESSFTILVKLFLFFCILFSDYAFIHIKTKTRSKQKYSRIASVPFAEHGSSFTDFFQVISLSSCFHFPSTWGRHYRRESLAVSL